MEGSEEMSTLAVTNDRASVRPRMYANGAISIVPSSR